MWLNGDRASRTYIGWMGYSRRVAHMPKTEGKEPGALEAQILPSAVPSHSILRSSVKNLTSPFSATFSHPKKFCGNPQRPSVTRRDRSKLAPEVAARFLSFNSLLASVLASKSEVRSARAGATWRLTAARPARPRESARLVAFAFFVVGALAAALTYARIRDRCVRFVSQRARKLHTHSPPRARARSSCAHAFIRRGHARRASTLASRRRDDRSFSLPLSLSPLLRRPIVTSRVVIDRASTPPIDPSTVSRGATTAREGWTTERATRVRSIGSTSHLHNLRVDGEHVSRQTRSDDDDDDDDDDRRRRRTTDRRHDPSTDRVPRANSS